MLSIAIPHWQGRVSPVFDAAAVATVVDVETTTEINRRELPLGIQDIQARARLLADSGINVLICGAISRPQENAIGAMGIEIIPQICGQFECVLQAWLDGRLVKDEFLMPGCRGGGGRRRMRRGCGQGQGLGQGQGRGQGRGQGKGRQNF